MSFTNQIITNETLTQFNKTGNLQNIMFHYNNWQNVRFHGITDTHLYISHHSYTQSFHPTAHPIYTLHFNNASFEKCSFFNCYFVNCDFTDTKWQYSTIANCCFTYCNFSNTEFDNTLVASSHFNACKLLSLHFSKKSTFPTHLFTHNRISDDCNIDPDNPIILYTLINMFLAITNLKQISNVTPLIIIQEHLNHNLTIFTNPPPEPQKDFLQNLLIEYRHPEFLEWLIHKFPQYISLITKPPSTKEIRKLRLIG